MSPAPTDRKHRVLVFTTPTCPWCVRVKKYLRERQVPFREIDVARDHLPPVTSSGEPARPEFPSSRSTASRSSASTSPRSTSYSGSAPADRPTAPRPGNLP